MGILEALSTLHSSVCDSGVHIGTRVRQGLRNRPPQFLVLVQPMFALRHPSTVVESVRSVLDHQVVHEGTP